MAELHPTPVLATHGQVRSAPAGTVVVGYDATPEAAAALVWAADWADRQGCRLMVACAVDPLLPAVPDLRHGPDVGALRHAVGRVAGRGAELARRAHEDLDVRSVGAVGRPSAELVAMSESAELVVVGRRTRREHPTASLGSVSFALSAHARCPVVVVQGERRLGQGGPVVVGVDTSRASLRAVEFAARAAETAGVGLVIVSAWSGHEVEPWLAELWDESTPGADLAGEEYDRAAASVAAAEDHVARNHPGVPTSARTPQGSPPDVLLAEARDAGLLVVGARGGGGFVGLMLGSVSRGVLRQAELPVAVVRSGAI
ncbi:universal stress protein [Knoellia locipacati]|uniref:Universal stress protein n=1 Tax=Knoellia locipacati TaxID=882824 RepID=A0A512T369_9MICO|nr:universal stress protein [Knoellia locipacati]GEQ14666.1 universal stress protein [Knoellia locipacati]